MKNENKYGDKRMAFSILAAKISTSTSQEYYTASDGAPATGGPLVGAPARRSTATTIPTHYLTELFQINVADSQIVTDLLHTKESKTA